MSRLNGFEFPFSLDQKAVVIIHPLVTISFYILCSICLSPLKCLILLITFSVLVLLLIYFWFLCEYADSSLLEKSKLSFFPTPEKNSRYCSLCKKTILGLDHHCTWLNTCVGTGNYPEFYLMILLGTIQFSVQSILGILVFRSYLLPNSPFSLMENIPRLIFLLVHNIFSISLACSHCSLWIFHTFLMYNKCGTYDFLLRHQQIKREKKLKETKEKTTKERRRTAIEMKREKELWKLKYSKEQNDKNEDILINIHSNRL